MPPRPRRANSFGHSDASAPSGEVASSLELRRELANLQAQVRRLSIQRELAQQDAEQEHAADLEQMQKIQQAELERVRETSREELQSALTIVGQWIDGIERRETRDSISDAADNVSVGNASIDSESAAFEASLVESDSLGTPYHPYRPPLPTPATMPRSASSHPGMSSSSASAMLLPVLLRSLLASFSSLVEPLGRGLRLSDYAVIVAAGLKNCLSSPFMFGHSASQARLPRGSPSTVSRSSLHCHSACQTLAALMAPLVHLVSYSCTLLASRFTPRFSLHASPPPSRLSRAQELDAINHVERPFLEFAWWIARTCLPMAWRGARATVTTRAVLPSREAGHAIPVSVTVPAVGATGGEPPLLVMWMHGGGLFLGSVAGEAVLTSFFALRMRATVVSVDYRMVSATRARTRPPPASRLAHKRTAGRRPQRASNSAPALG